MKLTKLIFPMFLLIAMLALLPTVQITVTQAPASEVAQLLSADPPGVHDALQAPAPDFSIGMRLAIAPDAQAASLDEVVKQADENFDTFNAVLLFLLGFFPGALSVWLKFAPVVRQLLRVMNDTPDVSNDAFKARAEQAGLKLAAKAITKIT